MTTSADPSEDLRRRWIPDKAAVQAALDALEGEPAAEVAVIPMYQPGKTYGIWDVGQRVETIALTGDDVLLAVNSSATDGPVPGVRAAQDKAFELASLALAGCGDGKGTTAYAVVRRNGRTAVFEEILSAR